jgi:hypothetical protein
MPELPISDGKGNLVPFAGLIVIATMVHPDDLRQRADLVFVRSSLLRLSGRRDEEELPVPVRVLRSYLEAPAYAEVERLAAASGAGGAMAGDLLSRIVRYRSVCPEHASLMKAVWVEEHLLEHGTDRLGQKLPYSRTTILDNWTFFKPVAHFWAAVRRASEGEEGIAPPEFSLESEHGTPGLLSLAEYFRVIGESVKSRGQKDPTLDPATSWKVPSDLRLPELSAPPIWLALDEDEKKWLGTYRAPKRI